MHGTRSHDSLLRPGAIAVFMQMLDTTIVSTALPVMAAGLGAGRHAGRRRDRLRADRERAAGRPDRPAAAVRTDATPTGFPITFVLFRLAEPAVGTDLAAARGTGDVGGTIAPAVAREAIGAT